MPPDGTDYKNQGEEGYFVAGTGLRFGMIFLRLKKETAGTIMEQTRRQMEEEEENLRKILK
jgi:hypothetical protein